MVEYQVRLFTIQNQFYPVRPRLQDIAMAMYVK